MKNDLYTVIKFVFAKSAKDAIDKEKKLEPNEVFMDKDWKENKSETFNPIKGFEKKK